MSSHRKNEQGAVAILVALSLVVLIGFVSLAIDAGMGYDDRRDTQNTADNAALAAAWEACNPKVASSSNPQQAARRVALENGYDDSSPDVDVQVTKMSGNLYQVVILSTEGTTFGGAGPMSAQDMTVRSEATADCRAFPFLGGYALFAGGPSSCIGGVQMDLSGSSQIVNGGIHSNGDMKITGSAPDINGAITYLGGFSGDAGDTTPEKIFGGPIAYPLEITISDFQAGGSKAVAAGTEYYTFSSDITDTSLKTGGYAVNAGAGITEITKSGLYYTTGDIALTNTRVAAGVKVTFAAVGQISVQGSGSFTGFSPVTGGPLDPGVLAFSNYVNSTNPTCTGAAIRWSVSTGVWTGVMFAPNGAVVFSASSGGTLNGSIFAYTVDLSGASFNITWQDNPDGNPDFDLSLKK